MKTNYKYIVVPLLLLLIASFPIFGANTRIVKIDLDALGGSSPIAPASSSKGPRTLVRIETSSAMSEVAIKYIGGILFVTIAKPENRDLSSLKSLDYYANAPYGRRVRAKLQSDHEAIVLMADWEIKPLMRLVERNQNGLYSQIVIGKKMESFKPISIDAYLKHTMVGFICFLADNPGRFPHVNIVKTFKEQAIPGFNYSLDGTKLSFGERGTAGRYNFWDRQDRISPTQAMYTDWRQSYIFNVEGNILEISGTPFFLFVDANMTPPTYNDALRNDNYIHNANPMVYDAMARISRNLAFFRYVKWSEPDVWQKFYDTNINNDSIEDVEIETPAGFGF